MTTKTSSTTKAEPKTEVKAKAVKVGQVINFDTTFILRLPDGTVVTGRGSYLPRHPGTYVATIDGKKHTFEVGE